MHRFRATLRAALPQWGPAETTGVMFLHPARPHLMDHAAMGPAGTTGVRINPRNAGLVVDPPQWGPAGTTGVWLVDFVCCELRRYGTARAVHHC